MYWCLVFTIFGVHICDGFSGNTIKDYNNKDYLTASSSVVNKFEDNEIRGEWSISRYLGSWAEVSLTFYNSFFVSHSKKFTVWLRRDPKRWNLTLSEFI